MKLGYVLYLCHEEERLKEKIKTVLGSHNKKVINITEGHSVIVYTVQTVRIA